jgi:hypothetical protein
VVSFRHPAIRAFAGASARPARCRPKVWSARRACPSNEMFALIGESKPFTLLNNSLTCRLHGRLNSTGRVRRAFG